jgi:tetratricopeptide (TPR) repeat protein
MTADSALTAGIAAYQAGNHVAAIDHFTAAAALMPTAQEPRLLLGHIYREMGDLATAVTWLQAGLAFGPNLQAESGLGLSLLALGRAAEAEPHLRASVALAPGDANLAFALGNALYELRRFEEAVAAHRLALAANPAFADAWSNCGNALLAQKCFADAISCYRQAIALNPTHREAHSNLCSAFFHVGRHEEAVAAGIAAIAAAPDWPVPYSNISPPLRALGRFDEAIGFCLKGLALQPIYPEAYVNLGAALFEIGQFDNAVAASNIALQCRPEHTLALCNRGASFIGLGRIEEAIADLRRAQVLDPTDTEVAFNLGLALLMSGKHMREGFALYESRLARAEPPKRAFPKPRWQGEDIAGKTILLHAEQGFGDTLHFVRYASLVAERGARVVLETQPGLDRLCASVPGVAQVITEGASLPDFDVHCPLLSLPFVFGTDLATIPADIPYLFPVKGEEERWRGLLPAGQGLRVGLVWGGGHRPDQPRAFQVDLRRSLPLATLAPLGALAGVHFVSLQKGSPASQLVTPPFPIFDPMPEVQDFADTAALIAGLDLVISVDTAIAHLAGAMGKPVWMLSRFDGCWRWLQARSDSPWYPSLRLYRQKALGDWSPVVAAIAADLAAFAAEGRAATPRAA